MKKKANKSQASFARQEYQSQPQEENHLKLSPRDTIQFLEDLRNPPAPNAAAIAAAKRYKRRQNG